MEWANEEFFKKILGYPILTVSLKTENGEKEPIDINKDDVQIARIRRIADDLKIEKVDCEKIMTLGLYRKSIITLYSDVISSCAKCEGVDEGKLTLFTLFHEMMHAWFDRSSFDNSFIELDEAFAEMGALKICRLYDEMHQTNLHDVCVGITKKKQGSIGISFYGYGAFLDEYTEKQSNVYYLLKRMYKCESQNQILEQGQGVKDIVLAFRDQYPNGHEEELYNIIVKMFKNYIPTKS